MLGWKNQKLDEEIRYFRNRFSKVDENINISPSLSKERLLQLMETPTQDTDGLFKKMSEMLEGGFSRKLASGLCMLVLVIGLSVVFIKSPNIRENITGVIPKESSLLDSSAVTEDENPQDSVTMKARAFSEEIPESENNPASMLDSPAPATGAPEIESYSMAQDGVSPTSYDEISNALKNIPPQARKDIANTINISMLSILEGETTETDLGEILWKNNKVSIKSEALSDELEVPEDTDYILIGAEDLAMLTITEQRTYVTAYKLEKEKSKFYKYTEYSQQGNLYDCMMRQGEIFLLTSYSINPAAVTAAQKDSYIPQYWDSTDKGYEVSLQNLTYIPNLEAPNYMVISKANESSLIVKAFLGNRLSAWCDPESGIVSIDSSKESGEVEGSTITLK